MKNKIIREFKHGFIFFSIVYTVVTLISSSLQLYLGRPTDTNLHILDRAVVVLIAVITISLFDKIKFKSKILSYFIPYSISMGVVFLYVWASGFIELLHPNAYRDIFLNFTAVAICVMTVMTIKCKLKERNKSKQSENNLPL